MKKILSTRSLERVALVTFVCVILMIATLAGFSLAMSRNLQARAERVGHAQAVIMRLDRLSAALLALERDRRRYAQTGSPRDLAAYQLVESRVQPDLSGLAASAHDSPEQQDKIMALQPRIQAYLEQSDAVVAPAPNAATLDLRLINENAAQRSSETVYQSIQSLQSAEAELLGDRHAALDVSIRHAGQRILVLAVLLIASVGGIYGQVLRMLRRRGEAEARIQRLAYHDALTDLPNRRYFTDQVEADLERATQDGTQVALLYIDLDGFKQVNDTLGHAAGDRLLVEVAARLRACVRQGDLVARLGGDEFVISLAGIRREAHAAKVAGEILRKLAEPVDIDGQAARVTGSIGVSFFPDHGQGADALLRAADQALYACKGDGKNGYRVYAVGSAEKGRSEAA